MKVKVIGVFVAMMAIATMSWAGWEEDIRVAMKDAIGTSANSAIMVATDTDGGVIVSISNPHLTPKGNTKGKKLMPAASIRIASGYLATLSKNSPYINEILEVRGGVARHSMANYAIRGVPFVEHLSGIGLSFDGKPGYLVLDPNDPWVVYEIRRGKPDFDTLVIGIVMYPDGRVIPLKSFGLGKLSCGKHLELAVEATAK